MSIKLASIDSGNKQNDENNISSSQNHREMPQEDCGRKNSHHGHSHHDDPESEHGQPHKKHHLKEYRSGNDHAEHSNHSDTDSEQRHHHGEQHHHEEHQHHVECGCAHDHEEQHDHAEHHHHHDDCGCGHDHQEHQHHEEHHHHDDCGCGHDHEKHQHHEEHQHHDDCGCGHHHEKHQHHEEHQHHDDCGCGHHHEEHQRHEGDQHHGDCGCGHDHEGHHHHEEAAAASQPPVGKPVQIFILENLGCANCAAKMEKQIQQLPGISYASITYATKQLRVSGNHPEHLLSEFQKICSSIESEVKVIPRANSSTAKKDVNSTSDQSLSKNKKAGIEIGLGALLFICAKFLETSYSTVSMIIFLLSYVILGGRIVVTAVKHLFKGQVFDENFLMSVATIAAISISDYAEAVGVMLFFRVGELFEDIAVTKSRGQIMDAIDMRPEVVSLILENGEHTVIAAEQAKPGDHVIVRPGDRIPLDGTILDGESRIDTSAVTGEPVPVKVQKGDAVISGCVNTSGLLQIRVDKPLAESMVTRIMDSVENAAASKPKIDRFITRFARIYTPFVVLLAIGTAVIPSLVTGNWNYWIYTAITFLVISCPCALVLSVPLAFFSGIGAGSKRGILFKGGAALEALKNVKSVVMDKTGTITQGNFVVTGYNPVSGITNEQLLALAAACESSSTHPIGVSILTAANEKQLHLEVPTAVKEISGKGIQAQLASGETLCGNRKLLEAFHIDLSEYRRKQYGTEVLVACRGRYIGHLIISDTIKNDAKDAVGSLKQRGLTTAMLTGDARESAEAIAKEAGIDHVYAKLLPEDKLTKVKNIREQHGAVLFVGDGINDAPVLAGADVGAAMGSGADAAIEAADVVFMSSSVSAIPDAIAIAAKTGNIAVQNVAFALVIKALVMVLGLAGYANMWMAVFADTGVAMICILNSIRVLYSKK